MRDYRHIVTREVSTPYREKNFLKPRGPSAGREPREVVDCLYLGFLKNATGCGSEQPPLTDPGLNKGLE